MAELARDWPSDLTNVRAQAVRWGVDVILTDVTKVWLDLRNALHGERSRAMPITGYRRAHDLCPFPYSVDYDKIAAQYGRTFLWTSWKFYTPATRLGARSSRAYIESVVGPFDHVQDASPAAPRVSASA